MSVLSAGLQSVGLSVSRRLPRRAPRRRGAREAGLSRLGRPVTIASRLAIIRVAHGHGPGTEVRV